MTSSVPLRIDSDLAFVVTGPKGPVTGRVDAAGSLVRISASDPRAVLDALGARGARRGGLGTLGAGLVDSGLTLDVGGPAGDLLTAGAGVHSRLGALLTGSPHVRLRSARALVLGARLGTPPRAVPLLAWAGGAAAVLWFALRRRSVARTAPRQR